MTNMYCVYYLLEVCQTLSGVNTGKSAGPNWRAVHVLKEFAEQLMHFIKGIFNIFLCQAVVPSSYKASTIILVPKNLLKCVVLRTDRHKAGAT